MRAPEDIAPDSLLWMQLLYYRLTGQLDRIPAGDKTKDSEEKLGLGRNAYFYLGYCEPEYGDRVNAHRNRFSRQTLPRTTPFDTGGLAQGHVSTTPPMNNVEMSTFVAHHSYVGDAYRMPFRRWTRHAFGRLSQYVHGEPPTKPHAEMIDMGKGDARSWVWEGRIRSDSYSEHPFRPVRVYVRPFDKRAYLDWILDQAFLNERDAAAHMKMVERIFDEVDNPVAMMRRFLTRGRRVRS